MMTGSYLTLSSFTRWDRIANSTLIAERQFRFLISLSKSLIWHPIRLLREINGRRKFDAERVVRIMLNAPSYGQNNNRSRIPEKSARSLPITYDIVGHLPSR